MNFQAGFFEAEGGFWFAVGGLVLIALGALLVGRWRRWY
jgi:LPXTG-motif cell wall-anchored protein